MPPTPATETVRLTWRLALENRWVAQIPRASAGQRQWRSLGGDFTGFLLYLGDKCDADGVNVKTPPSVPTVATFTRTSKETVIRFYAAAEAAGLIVINRTTKGLQRGYRLTFPLGDRPDWQACLDVLRDDRRRIANEERRGAHPSAHAEGLKDPERSARAERSGEAAGGEPSARNASSVPHVTPRPSARAEATRPTRGDTLTVDAVRTVAVHAREGGTEEEAILQADGDRAWVRFRAALPVSVRAAAIQLPARHPVRKRAAEAVAGALVAPEVLATAVAAEPMPPDADDPAAVVAERLQRALDALAGDANVRFGAIGDASMQGDSYA
ncbi:hypothetical protein [Streptomyces albireticuli]|uniref:hypothetical protein n=1 Tax=Streptomyces albireticuli TaxID=1940 RepID=UPI003684563E